MFHSICKKCGAIYHDDVIWANACRCPDCGTNDWEDGAAPLLGERII